MKRDVQLRILDALRAHCYKNGNAPSLAELKKSLGLSRSTISLYLSSLCQEGHVSKGAGGHWLPLSGKKPLELPYLTDANEFSILEHPVPDYVPDLLSISTALISPNLLEGGIFAMRAPDDLADETFIGTTIIFSRNRQGMAGDVVLADVNGEWMVGVLQSNRKAIVPAGYCNEVEITNISAVALGKFSVMVYIKRLKKHVPERHVEDS